MDQEESTNTKFLCLFFMEDRSLSVLSQNDKNLTISELTEGSNCSMKWMGRKEYKCKIVKIHDNKDFLDKWASKVNNSVLKKHADSKDLEVSHLINEILNFKEASSSGKRKRIETTRSKESKIQDEEISPKKKKTASVKEKSEEESPLKKRNVTEKEEMDHPKKKKNTKEKEKASPQKQENLKKKDTQIAPAKKSVDSLERKKQTKEQFKKKVEATAAASMSMEIVSMASQFSIDKDTTSPSAPTATEMETEKTELNLVKSPLKSTCTTSHQSAPENEKEPTLNLAATYINLDSNQQTVSTPLTETWGLCQRSQEGFEMHQTFALSNDSFRLPATNMTNGIIPVPSPQVLETMRGIMHPDFQTYIREVLNHYGQNQNYSSHQDYNNYDASISAGNMNDCYTISPRRSPRFLKTSTPKHTKSPAKSPAVKSTTLRRSLLPTLSEQSEDDTVTDTSSATVTTLNTSKVTPQRSVPPSNNSEGKRNNSSAIETTQRSSAPSVSRRETVRLIESCPIEVDKINLKKASQMAKKHSNPGYSLCLKLIPLLFSDEELALSRGQGFNKAKPGDIRPTLSKKKIELMKDYVKSWCLKHGFNVPLDSKLNDGVTERIAYSRKLLKRQTKD